MAKSEPQNRAASTGSNETHTQQTAASAEPPTAQHLERERLAREAEAKAQQEAEERRIARENSPDA